MASFWEVIAALFASIATFFTTFALIFASINTWYGFRYRRDANLSLRKDYHISIISLYENLINNLDDRAKIKEEKYDLQLSAYFSSHIAKKRNKTKRFSPRKDFQKDFLLKQFRNWDKIENDFYITRRLTFNQFLAKTKLSDPITDTNELIKILVLVLINMYTDSLHLVNDADEYSRILKYMLSFSRMSSKRFNNVTKKIFFMSGSSNEKDELLKQMDEEIKLEEDIEFIVTFNKQDKNLMENFEINWVILLQEFEEFEKEFEILEKQSKNQ